ncbi:PASTA domain-containing protein [Bifidobacterium margollesii]|uniref:PASTA domain-containing protein n=1 Tax=Bifidobacterium margollesii TaxID=2020964 RepID=UPI0013FD68CF|nr:PASTA domain-containing protein [Bifidobacterium margollesii]
MLHADGEADDRSSVIDDSAESADPESASTSESETESEDAAESADEVSDEALSELSDTLAAVSDPDDREGNDSADTGQAGDSKQPDTEPNRPGNRLTLIIATIVAVALVVCGGLFATYRAGIWGRKTIPTAEEIQPQTGKRITADEVAKQLNDRGIKTTINRVYSGKDSGTFIGFDGVQYGESVKPSQTVTVNESMGPGVPKGTVGQSADKVTGTLKSMGAKVRYKQVVVSDTSAHKPGTVIATSPADGSALTDDYDNTIDVGVAVEGNGVGYDLFGMDKDRAKAELESKGYVVTLKPKFSSKAHLGKIMASNPMLGSSVPSGGEITLYYGVDASQVKTMFTQTLEGHKLIINKPSFLDGRFCKADSTGSGLSNDCFVLATSQEDGYLYGVFPESSGHKTLGGPADSGEYNNDIGFDYSVRSDWLTVSRDFQALGKAPGAVDDGLLINGKTGAFELFPIASAEGDVYCGDEAVGDSGGVSCVNGKRVFDPTMLSAPTGLVRKMNDFFLYVPVGADLKAVEDSGYFDASALAKARKQQAVDSDRPFIVMRDKSLYDKSQTETAYASNAAPNPFLPADPRVPGTDTSLKMKPAPSNETVYYLDEDYYRLDWSSLADANVAGADSSAKTSAPSDSQSGGGSPSSGADAASAKIFAELAGAQYAFSPSADGSMYSLMTLKSDGSFSGTTYVADLSGGDSVASAPRKEYPFSGRFASATAGKNGTYVLQCDTSSLKTEDSGESGLKPCGKFTAYPSGTSISTLDTAVRLTLQTRGEADGPKDWLLVNEDAAGIYERTQR